MEMNISLQVVKVCYQSLKLSDYVDSIIERWNVLYIQVSGHLHAHKCKSVYMYSCSLQYTCINTSAFTRM